MWRFHPGTWRNWLSESRPIWRLEVKLTKKSQARLGPLYLQYEELVKQGGPKHILTIEVRKPWLLQTLPTSKWKTALCEYWSVHILLTAIFCTDRAHVSALKGWFIKVQIFHLYLIILLLLLLYFSPPSSLLVVVWQHAHWNCSSSWP